jgi:hypothetical protein
VNDYLEGALSREREEEIRGHASVCQECCNLLDRFAGMRDLFRLPEEDEVPEAEGLLENTRKRIMAAVETEEPAVRRWERFLRPPLRVSFAAAGLALVLGVGGYLVFGGRSPSAPPVPPTARVMRAAGEAMELRAIPRAADAYPMASRALLGAGGAAAVSAGVARATNRVYNFPAARPRPVAEYATYSGVAHAF